MNEISGKPARRGAPALDSSQGPDMRSWLATLEAAGELKRVAAEVDWDEEIGAIARVNLASAARGCCSRRSRTTERAAAPNSSPRGVGNRAQMSCCSACRNTDEASCAT